MISKNLSKTSPKPLQKPLQNRSKNHSKIDPKTSPKPTSQKSRFAYIYIYDFGATWSNIGTGSAFNRWHYIALKKSKEGC